jgi:YidC/Oxa1 family membrane protein insertase
MQQKNFVIFLLLAFAILFLWLPLQRWIWPPPPPPPKEHLPEPQLVASLPLQVPGLVQQLPSFPGLTGAWRLGTDYAVADWVARHPEAWFAPPKAERPPVAKKAPEKKPPPRPPAEHREITLGDLQRFNIQLKVTTRGGAIQNLILPGFEGADRLGRAEHHALNLIPDNPANPSFAVNHFAKLDGNNPEELVDTLGRLEWTVDGVVNGPDDPVHKVVLKANPPPVVVVDGKPQTVQVTKIFTLRPGDYHVGLELRFQLDSASDKPVHFYYQLAGPNDLPVEGEWYARISRTAVFGGFDSKGGNIWRAEQTAQQIGYQGGGRDIRREEGKYLRWGGIETQNFASMMVVDNEQDDKRFVLWGRPTLEWENPQHQNHFLDEITARLNADAELKPGVTVVHKYLLYNGPAKVRLLGQLEGDRAVATELVDRYETTLHLNKLTDYGKFGFWTDLIIFFTNVMHSLLWFLRSKLLLPYGVCILTLTVLVRGIMFPLSRRQAIASAKMQAKMQELAPEIKQLEAKYKNEPMELQRAKSELMMKRGIHPMAMLGSCWIIILQMPIFMGLYFALQESIHFRLAHFLWIENLSAPDMLFEWGEKIPYISRPVDQGSSWIYLGPFFNILPICWVVLQIIQQKMMMPPAMDEQTAMQQKMMKWMMVIIGYAFYKVAAGLCLYFIASGLWTIAERKFLPKAKPATAPGTPPGAKGKTGPSGGAKAKPGKPSNGNGALQKVKDLWEKVLKEAKKK